MTSPALFIGCADAGRALVLKPFLEKDYTLYFFAPAEVKRQLEDGGCSRVYEIKKERSWWGRSLDPIRRAAIEAKPIAVVSDFDPLTARFAKEAKITLIYCVTQHCFSRMTFFSPFPAADLSIVSSFFRQKDTPKIKHVFSFIREGAQRHRSVSDGYALVCTNEKWGDLLVKQFRKMSTPAKFYGIRGEEQQNTADSEAFLKDLSACHYLVCHGDSALLGKALYYGKYTYVLPETEEQKQNAKALKAIEYGDYCLPELFESNAFRRSVQAPPKLKREEDNGAFHAAKYIKELLYRI